MATYNPAQASSTNPNQLLVKELDTSYGGHSSEGGVGLG